MATASRFQDRGVLAPHAFFAEAIPNRSLANSSAANLVFCMAGSVFPTNYWASESFYQLHCYYFLTSLGTF